MTSSPLVSSDVGQSESLDISDHTFTSDLCCQDWDLSDHSDDSTEDLHHFHSGSKSVTFGKVRVRSYPLILGDNPSCSRGLPVTLDWKSIGQSEEFDLNVMDSDDLPRRPVARLSSQSRHALLLRMGVDQRDTCNISKEIDDIKKSRSLSCLDHRHVNAATTNSQPKQKERQLTSKQVGKKFSIKQFNMDEYLRMVSYRRQKS